MAPQEKLFVPQLRLPVLRAPVNSPCSLLRIPVQAVMAECIPTLTGAVLTSPIRVTLLVLMSPIRVGRVALPIPVRKVGIRSLKTRAAPLSLDIFAIMANCFPGSLSLSGPIARTVEAVRRTWFRVNSLPLGIRGWVPIFVSFVRNGLTREVVPRLTLGTSFRVTIRLFPVLVLGFTLTS